MDRKYNFAAGPAMLPEDVLREAREELLSWHGSGMSIMEVSHRGPEFETVIHESQQDLKSLLNIPDNYHVLFLQGGARLQFSMIPMNILGSKKKAGYVNTGVWSKQALEEAKRYCDVTVVADSESDHYTSIPEYNTWQFADDLAYLYYVDNETVNGVEFPDIPETNQVLVSDMSSNLLSRPVDISKFGIVYACAQKNIGPAGLTIVIIRDDLLEREPLAFAPSMLRYELHVKNQSLLNTPPTFSWYMAGLVFKYLKAHGGLAAMAAINQKKSQKLYEFIDSSQFYQNPVRPRYRSRMNVVFTLTDNNLDALFLKLAEKEGLTNLKGHRIVGGMRASIYNAMPEAGVDALIDFMQHFVKHHG